MEYLPPGYEINRPPFIVRFYGDILLFSVVLVFLVNHFVHNRGYKFRKNLSDIAEGNIMEKESLDVLAYCVKCKEKRPMNDLSYKVLKMSKGTRRYAQGTCPVCGTKMSVTVKKED
jgi:hypothetical protein